VMDCRVKPGNDVHMIQMDLLMPIVSEQNVLPSCAF
jgi:hypothetical protein